MTAGLAQQDSSRYWERLINVLGGFQEPRIEVELPDGGKEGLFSVIKKPKDFRCDGGGGGVLI